MVYFLCWFCYIHYFCRASVLSSSFLLGSNSCYIISFIVMFIPWVLLSLLWTYFRNAIFSLISWRTITNFYLLHGVIFMQYSLYDFWLSHRPIPHPPQMSLHKIYFGSFWIIGHLWTGDILPRSAVFAQQESGKGPRGVVGKGRQLKFSQLSWETFSLTLFLVLTLSTQWVESVDVHIFLNMPCLLPQPTHTSWLYHSMQRLLRLVLGLPPFLENSELYWLCLISAVRHLLCIS